MDKKIQEKFVKYLVSKYGQDGAKKKLEKIQKTKKIDDEDIKGFQESQQQETKKAAHGAKLNYFKSLKHQCADDEELYYYKKGGRVGCGCKKMEDGGKPKSEESWKEKFEKVRQKAKEIAYSTAEKVSKAGQNIINNERNQPFKKTEKKGMGGCAVTNFRNRKK